jgi:peroxiredoxin family protein
MEQNALVNKVQELESRLAKLEQHNSHLTIILFSGDFDKVMAAIIIATGAQAMAKKVSLFVTFWGLDAIKKPKMKTSGKKFLEKMVLWMRPKGPLKLGTSKMNFGGIGPHLLRYMMGKKKVISLPALIEIAREGGIKIIGCQMSMDVMGIKKEDLIDGVEVGGAATFLGESYRSNTTLFI